MEPLLQAQSLGQLFEAIRLVVGGYTLKQSRARLFLLDRTRDLLWTVHASAKHQKPEHHHGGSEGVLAVPLTNGKSKVGGRTFEDVLNHDNVLNRLPPLPSRGDQVFWVMSYDLDHKRWCGQVHSICSTMPRLIFLNVV